MEMWIIDADLNIYFVLMLEYLDIVSILNINAAGKCEEMPLWIQIERLHFFFFNFIYRLFK